MVRLSTVGFTVVSLCLKESLAMPTRGRFVCHVHCLAHDGVVRSSPCRPHHEIFGRNLYHMFVPAYSASQYLVLFCFVVFEFPSNSYVHSIPFASGFSTYGSVMIYYGIHSFIFVRMFIVKTICCNFYPLILLIFVYQDANGCHPLQDGSANASESGSK